MSDFTCYVGEQIRQYRKAGKMTMQELADAIHKSRATICKYESGEISVDIETLYEISQVLQVSISQLTFRNRSMNRSVFRDGGKRAHSFRRGDYIYIFMTDAIREQKMVLSIFMKRRENLESTRQL